MNRKEEVQIRPTSCYGGEEERTPVWLPRGKEGERGFTFDGRKERGGGISRHNHPSHSRGKAPTISRRRGRETVEYHHLLWVEEGKKKRLGSIFHIIRREKKRRERGKALLFP